MRPLPVGNHERFSAGGPHDVVKRPHNRHSAGVLSGTPTAEGSWTFVVLAQGGGGTSDTETETLVVRQPVVASSPLALGSRASRAEVRVPFEAALIASGGQGTFTWTLTSGALPPGVTLQPDGKISG